jgi:Cu(I)/Ag(I) efflux system periplasmic protein CusF
MKPITARAAAGAAALLASLALAQPAMAADPAPGADGEVRRIDRAQSRITLRHGEIRALDMPPMTMVFRVRDPKLLDGLAVGDRVRFEAVAADGSYVVTVIAKAAPAKP